MTKVEAIEKMKAHIKVTHTWFDKDEWVTMLGNSIILEDGVICTQEEFWHYRTDDSWNDGYSIFEQ